MAPLYDPVTTRVFPRLRHDRMALKVNGKDDRLRRTDFRALATTAGARASDADAAMDEIIERLKEAIGGDLAAGSAGRWRGGPAHGRRYS